ncbi:MAG: SDR family oxidoreductase [Chloroflexota bacterium]|nr:SDR family oxidoreductase [Chloroflexota bacterium]
MILVVGASSHPGQKLIPMLAAKGYHIRALTRDPRKLDFARSLGVDVIEGDIRQPDTLLRACDGAEAVVSSVTAVGENLISEVDEAGNRSLMESAQRSGMKRFVFVSAYGAAQNHPVDFFRIKYWTEEYLKSLRMEYSILRPTAFMGTWCRRIGAQVLNDRPVTIFGNGKNPINFISAEDVAKFIVLALEDPRLKNQTLTIGGPQNLTFEEVIAIYERISGKQARKTYTPTWQMQLMSTLYKPFNETRSRFMAIRNELATSNWQVDMSEMVKHYPINLTRLDESISKLQNSDDQKVN